MTSGGNDFYYFPENQLQNWRNRSVDTCAYVLSKEFGCWTLCLTSAFGPLATQPFNEKKKLRKIGNNVEIRMVSNK